MIDPVRVGYTGAARAWATDAMLAYGPLAHHLVDQFSLPRSVRLVLDAGAGTGAVAAAIGDLDATVVALDLQLEMLATGPTRLAIAADVTALPCRSATFDAVVAAFVLNHVQHPDLALTEMGRVCVPGGTILASTFASERAVAKGAVDDVAARYGWRKPSWYVAMERRAAAVGTRAGLNAAATAAGLVDVVVTESSVDVGLDDPVAVARYRLGMPQIAPFVASLPVDRRTALRHDVVDAIVATDVAFRPTVIELACRVR